MEYLDKEGVAQLSYLVKNDIYSSDRQVINLLKEDINKVDNNVINLQSYTSSHFLDVSNNMNSMNTRMNSYEQETNNVLLGVSDNIQSLDNRVTSIENSLGYFDSSIRSTDLNVQALDNRVSESENYIKVVDNNFLNFQRDTLNSIANLESTDRDFNNRIKLLESTSSTSITYGTEDLVAGESYLKTGTFYFVYE